MTHLALKLPFFLRFWQPSFTWILVLSGGHLWHQFGQIAFFNTAAVSSYNSCPHGSICSRRSYSTQACVSPASCLQRPPHASTCFPLNKIYKYKISAVFAPFLQLVDKWQNGKNAQIFTVICNCAGCWTSSKEWMNPTEKLPSSF